MILVIRINYTNSGISGFDNVRSQKMTEYPTDNPYAEKIRI